MNNNNITSANSFIGKNVEVTIDRQLGSKHPKHDFIYELNYGYIENTLSADGEELDAYLIGINKPISHGRGKVIAVLHRTNDDDDKLIVSHDGSNINDNTIRKLTSFQEKFFKSEIIRSNN